MMEVMGEVRLVVEDDVQAPSTCSALQLLPAHRPLLAGPCIALLNHTPAAFHRTSFLAIQSHTSA